MKLKPKVVIFDLGNVIIPFSHEKACRELEKLSEFTADQIQNIIFRSIHLKLYAEGEMTSQQFYTWVVGQIAIKSLSFRGFAKIWNDIFGENPDIDGLLERIKPGIKKFCLSDTNPLHWQRTSKTPLVRKYFPRQKQQILSFRMGLLKPDNKTFLNAIQISGTSPQEIVYVDDIPEYVRAFEKLDVKGIVYNCQTDPIEVLEGRLLELGILV